MPQQPSGFLIARDGEGYGEVYPLQSGEVTTVGRAPDSTIVVRDDLVSRRHAELHYTKKGWTVRDLNSLNGTRINGERIRGERVLQAEDELTVGKLICLFVHTLDELPDIPIPPGSEPHPTGGLEITRRLGQTRYIPSTTATEGVILPPPTERLSAREGASEALATLYHLALEMSEAKTPVDLAEQAVEALLQSTPAEVCAVLTLRGSNELDPLIHRAKLTAPPTYHKVSDFVGREVLSARQAVLAEDVTDDQALRDRESLTEMRVASLICAPILAEQKIIGLIHLYSTSTTARLNADDLEFTLAVAHQCGVVWQKLRRQSELSVENRELRDQLRIDSELVCRDPAMKKVEVQIARVASGRATVLIRGESGVGKELVARAIHYTSPRKESPFVCLNCAALTETLLESELFGHEKGSFTGATERMIGKFESADQGSIFLDEIGEMALSTQAKFLRVLEGQPFERVGGNVPIKVDVRVIAATNRPLEEAVREGTFRKDLYFRLQVIQVDVPPLRERPADVAAIAEHFLQRFSRETARKFKGFTPAAVRQLQEYHWPGNVRELRNVVERAVTLGTPPVIDIGDIWLSPLGAHVDTPPAPVAYQPCSLEEMEKEHILRTLDHTDWNKSQAASILGIERSTLDRKIRAFQLKRE
ncbi:MAG: sigma 54-interacting transcriptional regulator [Bacteroidales bacterium]|nr:sigma 54-interacting transcriptional regulator [Bacteroidales bacterium]